MLYTLYTSMLSPQMRSDIDGWIEFFIVSYVIRPTPIPNSAPFSVTRLLPAISPPSPPALKRIHVAWVLGIPNQSTAKPPL